MTNGVGQFRSGPCGAAANELESQALQDGVGVGSASLDDVLGGASATPVKPWSLRTWRDTMRVARENVGAA